MLPRATRWFAIALAAFLFHQQLPVLGLAFNADDMSCSCKEKGMSCCRRAHGHGQTSGPAFSSRDCSEQCQVLVFQSQPVAETVLADNLKADLAPAISLPLAGARWFPSARRDAVLFQRPPPIIS